MTSPHYHYLRIIPYPTATTKWTPIPLEASSWAATIFIKVHFHALFICSCLPLYLQKLFTNFITFTSTSQVDRHLCDYFSPYKLFSEGFLPVSFCLSSFWCFWGFFIRFYLMRKGLIVYWFNCWTFISAKLSRSPWGWVFSS